MKLLIPFTLLVRARHISPTNMAGRRMMIFGSFKTDSTPATSVFIVGFSNIAICVPSSLTTVLGSTIKRAAKTKALPQKLADSSILIRSKCYIQGHDNQEDHPNSSRDSGCSRLMKVGTKRNDGTYSRTRRSEHPLRSDELFHVRILKRMTSDWGIPYHCFLRFFSISKLNES